jgi:hypothetical protein
VDRPGDRQADPLPAGRAHLRTQCGGELPDAHRRHLGRVGGDGQRRPPGRRLQRLRLPGYAHDLNPVEMVWGNVKAVELANLCADTIDQARAAAEPGLKRSAPARSFASPSFTTAGFPYDHGSPDYRKVFKLARGTTPGTPLA